MDVLAEADTGTTGHYLTLDLPCSNIQQDVHPLPIQMPNGEIIKSTHTALLYHPDLPLHALQAHLFPGITNSLMSIGTLYNHGCEAIFNDKYIHIKNNQIGKIIMRGTRDARTNLHMLNFTQQKKLMRKSTTPDEYFSGSACECKFKSTLVDYHHASCLIPTHSEGGKQSQKNSSLLGQTYNSTWCTNTSRKNNQPYLGTSSNRGRASDKHKKISCIQNQIQSKTSSHNPCSQKTPILSSSR